MKSCSSPEVRRCRPLLGTFVEIAARGRDTTILRRGIDAAFHAVKQVHRLMSFHDPASDVSRMNRDAFSGGVSVHPWTCQVLKAAKRFGQESDGAFDVAVAPVLMASNHLPNLGYHCEVGATSRDILLSGNCRVSFERKLVVDLGGIAKGFAVDRAVEALQNAGVRSGIVNAGGDLRFFGTSRQKIHIRHPGEPLDPVGIIALRRRAMATSATYFNSSDRFGRQTSQLLDGRTRRPAAGAISVTVAADDCMTADALTKIVFALWEESSLLLQHYGADALLLECDGVPRWAFTTDQCVSRAVA